MAHSQRGNILFLILLAVVLFAALSYAVTSTTRGGGNNASSENYTAMVANVMQYGSLVQNTVNRLMLVNNCKDTDIDFYTPNINSSASYQHSPDTPDKCKVFNPAGGGVSYQKISDLIRRQGPTFNYDDYSSGTDIMSVGTNCTNATCIDIYWIIELNAFSNGGIADPDRDAFCRAYNKAATGAATIINLSAGIAMLPRFNGVYTYSRQVAGLENISTACYIASDFPGRMFIYYTVLAR